MGSPSKGSCLDKIRRLAWCPAVVAAAAWEPGAARADPPTPTPAPPPLVVHEWGTFTHFAGSDGVNLEFKTAVGADLPAFVLDRRRQAELFDARLVAARNMAAVGKGTVASYLRMETPVIYFYTDRPTEAEVSVAFPQGLMTEFYPPVRQMGPRYRPGQKDRVPTGEAPAALVPPGAAVAAVRLPTPAAPLPAAPVAPAGRPAVAPGREGIDDAPGYTPDQSFLRWGKVFLLPVNAIKDQPHPELIAPPAVSGDNHYAFARETDSALVRMRELANGQTYYEKFLFYRGVGNFHMPLRGEAMGQDHFRFSTPCKGGIDDLAHAFLVEIHGQRVRFAEVKPADWKMWSVEAALPAEGSDLEHLGEAMVRALIEEGLFEKEARAMVRTWRSAWFGEEGVRLLYTVPRPLTDRLLPLRVTPTPVKTVRVMVGRLELMTPETEARVSAAIKALGAEAFADRESATRALSALGRFAEPTLQRVMGASPDEEVRGRAKVLLERLRQ